MLSVAFMQSWSHRAHTHTHTHAHANLGHATLMYNPRGNRIVSRRDASPRPSMVLTCVLALISLISLLSLLCVLALVSMVWPMV